MKYIKEYKNFILIMFGLSIMGICIGTTYDYAIDEFLFNVNNGFAIMLEAVCYYPVYIIMPIFINLLILKYDNKNIKYIGYFFSTFILFVMIVCGIIFLKERNIYIISFNISIILTLIISVVLQIFMCRILKKVSQSTRKKIFFICIAGLFLMLWKVILISCAKRIVGRARFCNIVKGIGYYTPWYVINRPYMGSSFPSGHTGGASGMLLILLIPMLFENMKKYKMIFELTVFLYIIVAAFSRLVLGKHMLSDVSSAVVIMTFGFTVSLYILEKAEKSKRINKIV